MRGHRHEQQDDVTEEVTDVSYRRLTGSAAQNYERYFVPAIASRVADELLRAAGLAPGARVLDVGCGTGLIARRAAEAVRAEGSVSAIDLAPDMVELARSIDHPAGSEIHWHQGDAAFLPFDDADFDVVLCQMSLMFMEDRAAALREMHRVLAVGGRVVVNTPGPIQPPFELMEQAIVEHINPDLAGFVRMVFSINQPDTLDALLRDAGFSAVETRLYSAALDLPAPAEFLWQYINLTPMGPIVAAAPEAGKAAMEKQVTETWQPFVRAGRTPINQPMVLATGTRS